MIPLADLAAKKTGSVDPAKYPNESFDLYSIPAFDAGQPEVRAGSEIGSTKQIVQPHDILLSKIVPHIRRTWVVGENRGRRIIASGEWIVFRSDKVRPDFLRNFLLGDPFHTQFMRTVSGIGGSLVRARPSEVFKIKMPLPSLVEQERIVKLLDEANDLRKLRAQADSRTTALIPALFNEMFGDLKSNLRNWNFVTIGDILAKPVQNGAYFPKEMYVDDNEGVEMVHMGDAFHGVVKRGKLKRVNCGPDERKKYSVNNNDILIARRSINYEGAAKPCLVPPIAEPLIFESSLIRVTPDPKKIDRVFLFAYLWDPVAREKFVLPNVTRSTISGINQAGLLRIRVPLPPLLLQKEFARRIAEIREFEAGQAASRESVECLFQSMLHRAFNGEL